MKSYIAVALLSCVALLTGCASAPQLPVPLSAGALPSGGARIGVAMNTMPKVDTSFPGASCLLCLAAASVANSSLTQYTQTLSADDLSHLKDEVADSLRKRGQNVTVISEPVVVSDLPQAAAAGPNLARRDYSALGKKYQLDKLLVIDITEIGITRPYAAYVPNGEPQGVVRGTAYLVNLKDNSYEWYLPFKQAKNSSGPWDEAPSFPGLSNAYFQALEETRSTLLKPFN